MLDFNIGDHVYVIKRDGRKQLGEIKQIVRNLTEDEHFQAYVVTFVTSRGPISEHYLQFELQLGSREAGAPLCGSDS